MDNKKGQTDIGSKTAVLVAIVAGGIGLAGLYENMAGSSVLMSPGISNYSSVISVVLLLAGVVGTYFFFKKK
ncbi:hypothetical protein J4463_02275 [Candidatus Pacearchaeota archaeon]|nr:hypothetical protein [Candidatus Pacearchaeota archaeon]